jgi:hypothetical protein
MDRQKVIDYIICNFIAILMLLVVILVGITISDTQNTNIYIACCEQQNGTIEVTAFDCEYAPSECAFCSIPVNYSKCEINMIGGNNGK